MYKCTKCDRTLEAGEDYNFVYGKVVCLNCINLQEEEEKEKASLKENYDNVLQSYEKLLDEHALLVSKYEIMKDDYEQLEDKYKKVMKEHEELKTGKLKPSIPEKDNKPTKPKK